MNHSLRVNITTCGICNESNFEDFERVCKESYLPYVYPNLNYDIKIGEPLDLNNNTVKDGKIDQVCW